MKTFKKNPIFTGRERRAERVLSGRELAFYR